MPYIKQDYRKRLDPLINSIAEKMLEIMNKSDNPGENILKSMRYVAVQILKETSLDAAEAYQGERKMRYWLLVDQAGIALNIAHELYDRIFGSKDLQMTGGYKLGPVSYFEPVQEVLELNAVIDDLVSEIGLLGGTQGENYPGAYCGLVNYSLSTLMPELYLRLCQQGHYQELTRYHFAGLVLFWHGIARDLYVTAARPYEDEQIKKAGDVEIYEKVESFIFKKNISDPNLN